MKKFFLIVILTALILPNMAEAGKYKAKGWVYFSLVDVGLGLPPYAQGSLFKVSIGFPPPLGFGIGTSIGEGIIVNSKKYSSYYGEWERVWNGIGLLPLYLYYIPYVNWKKCEYYDWEHWKKFFHGFPITYLFYATNHWSHWAITPGTNLSSEYYDRLGLGCNWGWEYFRAGIEIGWHKLGHDNENYYGLSNSSVYIAGTMSLAADWFGIVEEIPPPSIQILASFTDADGNKILSGNEEGKLSISIPNKGKGKAEDVRLEVSILEKEFRDRIIYKEFKPVGNIGPYKKRQVNIPIKARGELPKGKFTVKITCLYKTEWGEEDSETEKITINTAPTTGMIKVAFENLSPEGLPSWIIPTPIEYADYEVKYEKDRVSILNLNTGERKSQNVSSTYKAQNFVKNFFLSWDKENPRIILSSKGGMVKARDLKLFVRLSDDRKLDKMKVYFNDRLHKTESFAERTETEREFSFPLKMGDNEIKIVLTDWVGKKDEKTIRFTRIRGETGTYIAGELPKGEPPPKLIIQASPIDGNNTIVGGREEGIKVVVTNRGKGIAKWVRVVLEGDEELAGIWGRERNLEDIKPGETKTAIFTLLMPTELKRKKAKIQVSVKEGRGYSPTVKPTLTFSLVPAEVEEEPVKIVEDVDYDIPKGRTRRKKGYALVIGLSKYLNVPAPKYARNDAETFKKYLSKVFGIDNIEMLLDENATVGAIRGELIDWMKEKKGFKVIYFAGHGVPDPKNPRKGDVYLLPYDGNPERKSTLISLKEISRLGAVSGDTVLVFLDACFSGSKGRTVQLASRPLAVAKISETDAITFAAAEGSQPAKEFEKTKHGYFTYYTLLGLKGKADASPYGNGDGWITTTELYKFVKDKVSDATNNVQVPVLRPKKEVKIGRIR